MPNTDLDIAMIRGRLENRVVGGRIYYHSILNSTMDEGHKLAECEGSEGSVVVAEQQTAGRGRFDRRWISQPGHNIEMSVLLCPGLGQLGYVNMAATLAVADTIAEITDLHPVIKWPNDVMIGGRKVSGILIETTFHGTCPIYAVVGIGIDVNFDPTEIPELANIATSICLETGLTTDRTEILLALLIRLDDLYKAVKRGVSLTDQWVSKLDTIGQTIKVRWGDRVVEGLAQGVNEQGNLLVADKNGSIVTVVAGEVTLQK